MPTLTLCELKDPGTPHLESYSPYSLKVHRALRWAGLRYDTRRGPHPGAFKHLNPTGQVPVLLVDDEPVSDSTAILRRIDLLSAGGLHGGLTKKELAESWLWEDWADASLNGYVVASRWADEANWPRVKEAFFGDAPKLVCAILTPRMRAGVIRDLVARDVWRAGPEACWTRLDAALDQLEARAPRRGYWVARERGPSAITAADVALFGQLQSLRCAITPRQQEMLQARRRLTAYLDRVDEATRQRRAVRPAHQRLSA